MIARNLPILLMTFAVMGCAGSWSRSYNRWQAMEEAGPHSAWARCIDDYSQRFLEPGSSEPPPTWHNPNDSAADQVVFTWVLAACAKHMTGHGWDHLQPEEYQRLLKDAHNHFFGVRASIQARFDLEVI